MRTSLPEYGNKYYNTTSVGGWSQCIKGKCRNTAKPYDGLNVLANCVGYANGRFAEIIGKDKIEYQLTCNAENFIERARNYGLQIGQTPKAGAIMCWEGIGSLAGHVAIVERVNNDGSVFTSESGYNSSPFWNSTRTNSNGRWGQNSNYRFRGFIYNPVEPKPEPTNKITEDGYWGKDTTKKAQKVFGTTIDGIVSNQYQSVGNKNPGLLSTTFQWKSSPKYGSNLIRTIQNKVGVNADGYIGTETIKAMQRWLGTPVDGKVSKPSTMVKAFQHWLNEVD